MEYFNVEGKRYDQRIEIGMYRICQELINDIIKHSGASEVVIQLFQNKNFLLLIVEDNAKGFKTEDSKDGIGFMNIHSRLSTVNGEVTLEPSLGNGIVVTIRIPIV